MSFTQCLTRRAAFDRRSVPGGQRRPRLAAVGLAGLVSLAIVFGLSASAASAAPTAFGLYFNIPGGGPSAVDPSTHRVYEVGTDEVTVVNGITGQQIQTVHIGGSAANAIAVDPVTHDVYVTNGVSGTGGGFLAIINGANLTAPVTTVAIPVYPQGVAVNSTTDTVYVSNGESIYVLDGANGRQLHAPIPVGLNPSALAVDPSSDTVYVADYQGASPPPRPSGEIWTINGATDTLDPDPITGVGLEPSSLAIDPATDTVFVAGFLSDNVSAIDEHTRAVVASVKLPLGAQATSSAMNIAVDPSLDTVYVADATADAVMLNGADLSATPVTLQVGPRSTYQTMDVSVDPSTHLSYFSGVNAEIGDVFGSLTAIAPFATSTPSAPSAVTASAEHGAAVVRFVPPSDGGSLITSYTATATDRTNPANSGQTATITGVTLAQGGPAITVTGLTAGDTYTLTVTATNAVGTGPASSPSNPVVPTPPIVKGGGGGGCVGSKCQ
jgi:DNA-binding beta-propeller fold protein YncE